MGELEFSVPYNGDAALLDKIFALKKRNGASIKEVFLSGPAEYCASGRVAYNGKLDSFSRMIDRIHHEGIRVNLIMNSTCEGAEWYSDAMAEYLESFLGYMVGKLGIESITLANPIIMKEIHDLTPEVELCASVLGDIDCVERAKYFKLVGASVVTPDVSINRNVSLLKQIKDETGLSLKIMVNEGCLYKCPLRKFHFNAISHIGMNSSMVGRGISRETFKAQVDQVAGKTFFLSCNSILSADPSQVLKSGWIRPEDLRLYDSVSSWFKISGRTVATGAVERMIQAYMDESYTGDLMDIMDSSLRMLSLSRGVSVDNTKLGEAEFARHVMGCSHDCVSCGFCDNLAKNLVVFDNFTEEKQADKQFFGR